jgi:hypothetical protein
MLLHGRAKVAALLFRSAGRPDFISGFSAVFVGVLGAWGFIAGGVFGSTSGIAGERFGPNSDLLIPIEWAFDFRR